MASTATRRTNPFPAFSRLRLFPLRRSSGHSGRGAGGSRRAGDRSAPQESEEHQARMAGMSKNPGLVDEMYQKLCSGNWNCRMSRQAGSAGLQRRGTQRAPKQQGGRSRGSPALSGAGRGELRIPPHTSRW